MYERLLKLYKNKIKVDITNASDDYYYFYNENNEIFGISKDISKNEYELIKGVYIEKTFNYNSQIQEQVYKYVFEQGLYPFKKERQNFLFYRTTACHDQINSLLKDIFKNVQVINYLEWEIVFYQKDYESNIKELFETISDDFSSKVYVHEGFYIYPDTLGNDLLMYINAFLSNPITSEKYYSDAVDLLYEVSKCHFDIVAGLMRQSLLKRITINPESVKIIDAFFKNELNVSKTATSLYMHRNTLNSKLDGISRQIGYNIHNFKYASGLLLIMNVRLD